MESVRGRKQNLLPPKAAKTLRFDNILVNNTGNRPDNYLLTIVPVKSLPDGIRWSFINELNQTVSNSGVIAPDRHKALSLILELPDNLPGSWSFYVQVTSETEPKTSDQLHLAVTVAGERRITLTPNGTSQVSPGSFVVFTPPTEQQRYCDGCLPLLYSLRIPVLIGNR